MLKVEELIISYMIDFSRSGGFHIIKQEITINYCMMMRFINGERLDIFS